MSDRKKVMVLAFACAPNWTSEPGVGWNFANQINKGYQTSVLTRNRYKKLIEGEPNVGITYIYCELPNFILKWEFKIPFGEQLYFFLWQWKAYFLARKYLKNNKIDLFHHLNFSISWLSPPAFLLNVPFIWGPIGGGDNIPFRFLKRMPLNAVIRETIYSKLNLLSRISIFSFLARKRSDAIIFRMQSSKENFPNVDRAKTYIISETATEPTFYEPKTRNKKDLLKVVCVGRMMSQKGYLYALEGFRKYLDNSGNGRLRIYGNGPQEDFLKKFVSDLDLSANVEFMGFVANDLVMDEMKQSHILLHPSFREGGSWSIMEAMSFGLPVICLNTSGPRDMVTNNCGIMIDLTTPIDVSHKIGEALLELERNETRYAKLSSNAIKRIREEYNWEKRREEIFSVYENVLSRSKTNN